MSMRCQGFTLKMLADSRFRKTTDYRFCRKMSVIEMVRFARSRSKSLGQEGSRSLYFFVNICY